MTHTPSRHRAFWRRLAMGVSALLLLASAAALGVVLTLLGERHGQRFDVTATAAHELAPRTQRLLDELQGDYELVVSADFSRVETWVQRQLGDLLVNLEERSPSLDATTIDISTPQGQSAFAGLRSRLATREADTIAQYQAEVGRAAVVLNALPDALGVFAQRLETTAELAPEDAALRATMLAWPPALANQGNTMRQAAERVASLSSDSSGSLAELEDARRIASRALAAIATDLGLIARGLDSVAASGEVDAALRDAARPLARAAGAQRDQLTQLRASLDRLETPDAVRVERVLRSGEAALVIGPEAKGVSAIEIGALLNPTAVAQAMGAQQTDLRQRAEDLIASAIAAVDRPDRPIVVLAHGEASRFVGQADVFTLLMRRLTLRGIDLVEWATVIDDTPPSLTEIDPSGLRPVVYVVLATDASASTRTTDGAGVDSTGMARAQTLARIATRLIEDGEPVLISLIPSALPSFGEDDPQQRALRLLGLEAHTDTPLLRDALAPDAPAGRICDPSLTARADAGDHPLLGAIAGLPTRLDWPIALTTLDSSEASVTPLIWTRDLSRQWRERNWMDYWRTPPQARIVSQDPPSYNEDTDARDGPWMVAAAVEMIGNEGPQRAVVVGANTWFTDGVTAPAVNIDGRLAPTHPGNTELFEASVLWLAGQVEQLAQGARARAVPLIRPLDAGYLRGVRWGVIAGLPILVLVLGVVWRAIRG